MQTDPSLLQTCNTSGISHDMLHCAASGKAAAQSDVQHTSPCLTAVEVYVLPLAEQL